MSGHHVLHVRRDERLLAGLHATGVRVDPADYPEFTVSCPTGACGYEGCPAVHVVDGVSADEGPWEALESAPFAEREQFEFHGELHTWSDLAQVWMVPSRTCAVEDEIRAWGDIPEGISIAVDGDYPIEAVWDWDGELCVRLIEAGV